MDNQFITLLYPLLDKLKNGSIIRKIVALIFRIWGALFAIALLVGAIMVIKEGFHEYMPWQATLAAVFGAIILLGLGLALFQIHFYHAQEIEDLGDSPFSLSPIVAIFIRTVGEIYALTCLLIGIILFISILVAGGNGFSLPRIPIIGEIMPNFHSGDATFLSGLLMLFYVFMTGFFAIMLAYFIAERIIVSTDMATNMRILVNSSAKEGLRNEANLGSSPSNKPNTTVLYADHSPQKPIRSETEVYAELEKLADLKEKGILSAEEFEKEKTALLKNL